MKRSISVALSVALVLLMIFSFAGCGEKDKFVGTWRTEMNMAEALNEEFGKDPEMGEYMKITDFTIVMNYTFNSDGTYKITTDRDSVAKAAENIKNDFTKGIRAYFEDQIAKDKLGISVDELLAYNNTTLEKLVEEGMGEMDFDKMANDIDNEGNYKVKDGKLFLSDGLEHSVDENVYEVYEFVGEDIKIVESVGGDSENEEALAKLYPYMLTKIVAQG